MSIKVIKKLVRQRIVYLYASQTGNFMHKKRFMAQKLSANSVTNAVGGIKTKKYFKIYKIILNMFCIFD